MRLFLKTKDFSVSGESFELRQDEEFDMLITHPQPENLAKYYDSEVYISHTDAKTSLVDRLYHWVKGYSLKKKIQIIDNQIDESKSLLDIGAGTGDFLKSAISKGFKVAGIEPNQKARTNAELKGITLHQDLADVKNHKFQVITMWHVLEHLPNLQEQIKQIAQLLESNGTLFVAVPNFKSFDAKYYGTHWAAYDVPRHLWHFSRQSIQMLFEKEKMEVVSIKPMLFDAFYVSLLSEKYKGNPFYLISAFFVGLWSNIRAFFSKEHSSLIYIIKKKD
ncbi:class I SAM-dependent methyltransferase [Flagellimonas sp. HMM57]|uniref:class I SAM-dependent methyltransferase n=1 Tax=unclassified Flagellimonas TaxID=2644544 RepID=UPI0013D22F98|nr:MULTISPECIES: class I SAM-dependent methyltransferase [unclassified Flagellimonas]UII77620.1 class I SAM-dependent methyltransferase [Flagellimonas sp. HMM57]